MTALALWSLLEPVVAARPLRAAIAFLAAQPALVLSYTLQGSVKEIGTVFAVILVAALVPVYVRESGTAARRGVPLAVAAGAAVGFVGAAVAVWLGPLLVAALAAAFYRQGRRGARRVLAQAALFVVVAGVLCWQTIAGLATYVDVATTVVTAQSGLGNLLGPLNELQMFGVWLTGDYRLAPGSMLTETYILIGVVVVAAGLGLGWLVRRRAWALLLLVAVSLFGWWYVTSRGSPWADGKALMIVSPVVVLVAGLGAAGLHAAGRKIEGVALVVLLGIGVLGSNALAYHDVALAPHDRMAELETDRLRPRRPRSDAVPGVRGIRQALPARGSAHRSERGMETVGRACARTARRHCAVRVRRGPRRAAARLRAGLPHDRPAPRVHVEPAACRLATHIDGRLLRGLGAWRHRGRRAPAAGRSRASRRPRRAAAPFAHSPGERATPARAWLPPRGRARR